MAGGDDQQHLLLNVDFDEAKEALLPRGSGSRRLSGQNLEDSLPRRSVARPVSRPKDQDIAKTRRIVYSMLALIALYASIEPFLRKALLSR
jgi:hypothetical protein